MVLLLALHGCFEGSFDVGEGGGTVGGGTALYGDTVDIATTPYRGEYGRAPVLASRPPSRELVVRDCYGDGARENARPAPSAPTGRVDHATKAKGGGSSRREERSAPAAPPMAPAPEPAPAPEGLDTIGRGQRGGGDAAAAPPPPPAKAPAAKPSPTEVAGPGTASPDPDDGRREGKAGKSKGRPRPPVQTPVVEHEKQPRNWDWGARVYLSNDDSMSLASAQRTLWALQRNVPLRAAEIRPHELLNYFSFDAVPPAEGRTFGVLGSATQVDDTLTVALAVRGANPERQPLDLTLLVDRSCSMSAEGRMDYTRRGLSQLTDNLQSGDRLDLVLFDSGVCTPIENFVVGRDDPAVLRDIVARMQPHSGTNLNLGLEAAYGIQTARDAAEVHGRNRRVVLVTDALLNEGQLDQGLVAQVGTNLEAHDIRLSGIGVGREFNDKMLDKLTENGKGAYVYLGSEAVVDRVFGPMFDALVRTVAHDVHFSIDLPPSLAMERFYGEESSTNREDVKPVHYYAGTTQLFLQDLHVSPQGAVREDPITMRIEFRDAVTDEPMIQELRTTVGALLDADPHNVQKGQALMAFADWTLAGAMQADPCGAPLDAYRRRAGSLEGDAEIAYVNGLVGSRCGVPMNDVVTRGVQLKLKIDADQPISNVSLVCGGRTRREPLRPGDNVARFDAVEPGACTVELDGQVPMAAAVEVPSTGGDLRCTVRGGRISCT